MVAAKIKEFLVLDSVKKLFIWGGLIATVLFWGAGIQERVNRMDDKLNTILESVKEEKTERKEMKNELARLGRGYDNLNLELRLRRVISDTIPLPTIDPLPPVNIHIEGQEDKKETTPTPQPTPSSTPQIPDVILSMLPIMIPTVLSMMFLGRRG